MTMENRSQTGHRDPVVIGPSEDGTHTNPDAYTGSGAPEARNRSFSALIKELRDESLTLLRQEVALAKTEMSEKASSASRNAASIALGGAVTAAGLLFLLIGAGFLIYLGLVELGLSHTMAGVLMPFIVGLVVTLIGYAMIRKGVNALQKLSPVPEKTAESLKEDKQWLQNKVQ